MDQENKNKPLKEETREIPEEKLPQADAPEEAVEASEPSTADASEETSDASEEEAVEETPEERKKRFWRENGSTVAMGVFVFIFVVTLLAGLWKPVVVHQTSMYPTLQERDYLFIFRTKNYQPGDIIVFDSFATGEEHLIKRVIATEGDHIQIHDGAVYVNDEKLQEDYLPDGLRTEGDVDLTLLPGELFVLGDNRTVSLDGRYFGAIEEENVLGEAKLRLFHKLTVF